MSSVVELQYNPFLPQVNIQIDGKQPASYSRLIQYSDEDIWEWASSIFNTIYDEIRDSYNLIFTGTGQDADVLLYVCGKDEHCIGFKKREFIIHESIQSRMGKIGRAHV